MDSRLHCPIEARHGALYEDLEALAEDVEKALGARSRNLDSCGAWAQLLSELRGLIRELSLTQNEEKLSSLLSRYLELEGKVKEIRNDLSSGEPRQGIGVNHRRRRP